MTGTTLPVDADMAATKEASSPVTQPAAADGDSTQNNVSMPGDVASDTAQTSAASFPGEILERFWRSVPPAGRVPLNNAQRSALLRRDEWLFPSPANIN
jgi:hypothetical protein